MKRKHKQTPEKRGGDLYRRISVLLQEARSRAIQSVNTVMVQSYWLIGREIVTAEQKGRVRSDYGKALIDSLSKKLTREYGRGWSPSHLWHIRQFYSLYQDRTSLIPHTPRADAARAKILHTLCAELSWSHYRILMRVENKHEQNAASNAGY